MAARYLPQDDRIALLLVQLGLCPTPDDRADLFLNACIEAGGSVILPGSGRDTHMAEVSLFDLCGRGQTSAAAIADWEASARDHMAARARAGAAEALLLGDLRSVSLAELAAAATTVRLYSRDAEAIARAAQIDRLLAEGELAR